MVSEPNRPFVTRLAAADLADALIRLLTAAHLAREIGEANRRRACQAYDQERMFAEYEALFTMPPPVSYPQIQQLGVRA